jgi:hypothetical protein
MAEQAAPVRRNVALNIIKLGMDTRHVIARFEAERQALAMHIARILDAGVARAERGAQGFLCCLFLDVRNNRTATALNAAENRVDADPLLQSRHSQPTTVL